MRKLLMSSALLSLGLVGPVVAHHVGETYQAGAIVVSHAWMHENAELAHSTSVYLTIDNQGDEADRLLGAEVSFADQVVFQAQTVSAEGVLQVSEVTSMQVAPGQVMTLKPGLAWIELESVHQTFEHGEHFDMTLTFAKAGVVQIEVEIEPVDDHDDEKEDVS